MEVGNGLVDGNGDGGMGGGDKGGDGDGDSGDNCGFNDSVEGGDAGKAAATVIEVQCGSGRDGGCNWRRVMDESMATLMVACVAETRAMTVMLRYRWRRVRRVRRVWRWWRWWRWRCGAAAVYILRQN